MLGGADDPNGELLSYILALTFTATQHRVAFHRRSANEPRLMVSTNSIGDIPIQGNIDYTNRFGIAVSRFFQLPAYDGSGN